MGRIKLRPLLSLVLVVFLFLSLLFSALGVSTLVRKYLWSRAHRESKSIATRVHRFLKNRDDRPRGGRVRNLDLGLRRFNRGPSQLLLLQDGEVIAGAEEGDRDWGGISSRLRSGFGVVEYEGAKWLVLVKDVESSLADRIAIVQPWSPSVKLLRSLVVYQFIVSLVILGLAVILASYLAKRLARPLEELRDFTDAVGHGEVKPAVQASVTEVAQLQSAFQEMSERVESAMTSQRRFVADASHELKTPLTAIAGMLELLQNMPQMTAEDRDQALGVARKEADRMQSLISDLLLLSRAQAKRSGKKEVVKLIPLAEDEIETLKLLFPEQNFELAGDRELSHEINPQAFSRVIRNLLENACHYGGGKAIKIEVSQEDGHKRLKVTDQGPGIAKDKQEHLFERFFRTDQGRARSDGGHGLGLAIVKALVEEAGGGIACHSKEGKGTQFEILFKKS